MKDTVVAGSLRVTDTLFSTTAQFQILRAPTSSNGTTFGPGSANNLLKSNGTSVYWTTLVSSDIPNLSTDKLTSGTLGVARGGTGVASFTANSLIMSGSTTTSALTTRAITDNTTNTAITNSNTNIPTMNTIYYGLVTVNNASQTRATGIYAPTSAGTANQLLVSSGGTSAPTWKATANGAAYATSANGALTFGTLPVAQGGTGATTPAGARANLEITPANINAVSKYGDTINGTLTMVTSNDSDGNGITCDIDNRNITIYKDSSSTSYEIPTISLYDNAAKNEVRISSDEGIEIYGPVPGASFMKLAYLNSDGLFVYNPATTRTNLNVPSTTGSGASGTWGISITGNAATATKATQDGSGNVITSKYVTIDTAQTMTGTKSWGILGEGGQLNGAATNGGINSIRIGDDVWLGDCNSSGIMGMKSTGSNCGFSMYNSSETNIGQLYFDGTNLVCTKNINANILGNAANVTGTVAVDHGGTGATTPAVVISNEYTSVLDVINAVKNTRVFPISVQKKGESTYNDMPTGCESNEWNIVLVGNATRCTAFLYIYGNTGIFKRDYFANNGGYWLAGWVKVSSITPADIGAVAKSGDTMTGSLTLDNADRSGRSIRFYTNGTETGWISTDNQTNVMQFLQHNPNVPGAFGLYQFPAANENPYGFYEILTTKSPVLVTQGGTGATTAAGARANLDITPANIGAFSGASSTRLLTATPISANSSINVAFQGGSVSNYAVLILGQNGYINDNREGFAGNNNVYFFPKVMRATNQWSPITPPDGSWSAWFLTNDQMHVINNTSTQINFRVDGIK